MSEKQGKMSEEQERNALINRIIELLRAASARELRIMLVATHGILDK